MAPRGAICFGCWTAAPSERFVGVELRRPAVGHELIAPGLLDLRAVDRPQRLAQGLQALEDRQRLLGRPVQRQG